MGKTPQSILDRNKKYRDNNIERVRFLSKERYKKYKKDTEYMKKRKASYDKSKEKRNKSTREWINRHPHFRWARSSFYTHKACGHEMLMTVGELEQKAKDATECPYCGVEFVWKCGLGFRSSSPTLDRIYNGNTITNENTEIICRRCNSSKGDRTRDSFLEYCKMIADKFCV